MKNTRLLKKILGWLCISVASGLVITVLVVWISGAAASSVSSFLRVGVAVPILLYYGIRLLRNKGNKAVQRT
jgi:high-affinity Fe2+/Pb2+ permease